MRKIQNRKVNEVTFVGSGVNAGDFFVWKTETGGGSGSRVPYRPQGATWPFARLSIGKPAVRFDINLLFVHKTAHRSDVTVALGKLGYVYFRTADKENEFGFCTLRLDALLGELRRHGYHLDESCQRNLRTAKILLFSITAVEVAVVVLVTVLGVLKPNGI